jgi:pyridoxamine 5'-phosphate oxidase-like protein
VAGITDAIAASLAGATEFTRSLFDEESWTAQQVVEFVNKRRNATVATVNPSGQPHAAVVIAASVRDSIFFTVAPQSVLARNLAANDRIALSVCDSTHAIMGQGKAVQVGPATELGALIAELADASQAGRFTPEGWDGYIYRVDFRRLFAN